MFCTKTNEWVGSSLNHWIVMQRNSRQFTQLGIATDWERGGGGSPDFYEFLQFDCSTIRSSSTWLRKSIHWIQTRSFLLHLIYFPPTPDIFFLLHLIYFWYIVFLPDLQLHQFVNHCTFLNHRNFVQTLRLFLEIMLPQEALFLQVIRLCSKQNCLY